MTLKTAALIAIIGQSTSFLFWQCFAFLNLPQLIMDLCGGYGNARIWFNAFGLVTGLISTGTLILFLITLYTKQKL